MASSRIIRVLRTFRSTDVKRLLQGAPLPVSTAVRLRAFNQGKVAVINYLLKVKKGVRENTNGPREGEGCVLRLVREHLCIWLALN